MKVSDKIFRSYDIRGIYPDEINEDISLHLGKAFGTYLSKHISSKQISVVVGRDNRASSPLLSDKFIEGLVSTGCKVIDTGITLTPIIHFLTVTKNFDSGIMVTASHNPKQYNGFRIDFALAKPFYGNDLRSLYEIMQNAGYIKGFGSVEKKDLSFEYVDYLKKSFKFSKDLKIVVDCGSGATGEIAPRIFESLNCSVAPIYCYYDNNFTHGVPDPENKLFMKELSGKVVENKAHVGFAFDTDGDRFGVADENGTSYDNDKLLLLFASDILSKHKGAAVVFDVKSSSVVEEVIKKLGGNFKILRTGHPYFVEELKNNAVLGCEFSGHAYFSDRYFGYDDGIYAACRVLEIMANSKKPLSHLMEEFPKRCHTSEIKIPCSDDKKFEIVESVSKKAKENKEYLNVLDIDGARVKVSETGWFLVRASNTSPYVSVRVEGKDLTEIGLIKNLVKNYLTDEKLDVKFIDEAEVYES